MREVVPHAVAHAVVFAVFAGLYSLAFTTGHFKSNTGVSLQRWDPVFYAASMHTLVGDNSVSAITSTGKALSSLHATLAFLLTIAVISLL